MSKLEHLQINATVQLEFDTAFLEVIDRKEESGKFSPTWHHAAGDRGGTATRLAARWAAGWQTAADAPAAARRRQPPGTRCRRNLVPAAVARSAWRVGRR